MENNHIKETNILKMSEVHLPHFPKKTWFRWWPPVEGQKLKLN